MRFVWFGSIVKTWWLRLGSEVKKYTLPIASRYIAITDSYQLGMEVETEMCGGEEWRWTISVWVCFVVR